MGPKSSKMKTSTDPLEKLQMQKKKRLEERKKLEKAKKKASLDAKKVQKNSLKKQNQQQQQQQQNSNVSNVNNVEYINFQNMNYNQIALMKLREQIRKDIPSFLLNQIILSVQFFGNFEVEKNSATQRLTRKEFELNQKLKNNNYSVFLTNVIDDAVDKRVRFKARHGPEKHKSYPLQLQTVYMVYENVQIYDPKYDHLQPVCRVDIDTDIIGDDKQKQGYIQLKLRDNNKKHSNEKKLYDSTYSTRNDLQYSGCISTASSVDSIYESESNSCKIDGVTLRRKHNQKQNIYENHSKKTIYDNSDTTSAYASNSETDYDYIVNLNTHQPLCNLIKSDETESSVSAIDNNVLPEFCITIVNQLKNDDDYSNYSDLDDDENRINKIKYLNSKQFFSYFMKFFIEHLACSLDITEDELNLATWKFSSIFTPKYEIIPVIHVQNWPECANEWIIRSRRNYTNPINGKLVQWPTPEMINQVRNYGCYVVPQGYVPKYEQNPNRELEWKIIFPEAEKYLESCLTSTQIKIFMICKTIIKTFIEPKSEMNGIYMFTIEHLRMHLFWECEKNFLAWNEEYLGERLIKFLKSFIRRLSKKSLPDYFLRDRNLFESIPDRYKNQLLIILTHIVENPVIYMLKTFKNLHQIKPFHGKLNYNKIYTSIVVDDLLNFAKQIKCCVKYNHNGEILRGNDNNSFSQNEINEEDSDTESENEGGLIAYYKKLEKFDEAKRRKTRKIKYREQRKIKKRQEREMERRPSEDSIDLKFILPERLDKIQRPIKKTEEMSRIEIDIKRSVVITEIFINHFIQMMKSMNELKSYDLVNIYKNQALRLCQILTDYNYPDDADKYKNNIKSLINSFKNNTILNNNEFPKLPSRTSVQPTESFNKGLLNQNSHSQYIEPNIFEADADDEDTNLLKMTKTVGKLVRPNSVRFAETTSFQTVADIHQQTNISKSESNLNHGILKSSSKREFDFSREEDIVEIRNVDINRDQTKVKSITLSRDSDEIEESRL